VNLILLEPGEIGAPLAPSDPRALHLTGVLRRAEGDLFDAGIVNGPRGKGLVLSIGPAGISFRFTATSVPAPAEPLHLLLALPRPQTARKILGEATTLGVASLRFFISEKGERAYASSTLWKSGAWRRHLLEGAAQAFDTRIPEVMHAPTLADAIASLPTPFARIALDNYEATRRLTPVAGDGPLVLAFGPERGWSAAERTLLRGASFEVAHLGTRVLRTETAVVAAVAIAKARP
jgi:RsmE family RNA methyltransferase